jgi:hypothetical protein
MYFQVLSCSFALLFFSNFNLCSAPKFVASFNFDVSSYCELMLLMLPVLFRQILLAQGGGGGGMSFIFCSFILSI